MTGEKRSRGDDSRGNHRDRDRGSGRDIDRRGDGSRNEQRFEKDDVSKTVIMKGLPALTTKAAVMPKNWKYQKDILCFFLNSMNSHVIIHQMFSSKFSAVQCPRALPASRYSTYS